MNNKLFEDKAEQLTKEYLKNNPDLKFIVIYDTDENGNPAVSFKIVKTEEEYSYEEPKRAEKLYEDWKELEKNNK